MHVKCTAINADSLANFGYSHLIENCFLHHAQQSLLDACLCLNCTRILLFLHMYHLKIFGFIILHVDKNTIWGDADMQNIRATLTGG